MMPDPTKEVYVAGTRTDLLVQTDELESRLDDPELRVFDCTVVLEVGPDGVSVRSGRDGWAEAHVPGGDFLELLDELSDPASPFRFMLPPAERFSEVMSAHGVGDGTRVVLYDRHNSAWAARVWWMLHAYGFDDAAVLDGGWTKWALEDRPTSTDAPAYPRVEFRARPRPGVFVGKEAVAAAVDEDATCLLNGLPVEMYRGEVPTVPGGRPGRIPTSLSMPVQELVDPTTNAYLPEPELRSRLERAGATSGGRVITYCGGGIAASGVAFALKLLGHDDVAVYDASLEEWATDPALPIEVG
jgi:thiosulfate/3-mercaptopyruvate sulfurtransferase